ncbi:hypothetical protein D7V80_10355 [Corallococcus sp. CA054B]|uniref:hypothetical protein n=1 Tax=Corallococcus sp. CA054B TaxID=2316734 RepID=UPI000EA2AA14|nr:hypothetical protein [Corallococcus sp. CA054B]RKG69008.1 hypothetical protein D7V80_10355 [Corallococcus sp. CA054B]
MTKIISKDIHCALCGAPHAQRLIASTSTFGNPDLDGRPAGMARSTLSHWVQECPNCGYCAAELSKAHPSARALVQSDSYRALCSDRSAPALATRFLRAALVREAAGDLSGAGHARLHAAWAADDAGAEQLASQWRSDAADALLASPGSTREAGDWRGWQAACVVDILRRAGRAVQARQHAERILDGGASPLVTQVLRFQLAALASGDMLRHTVDQALGRPEPAPGRRTLGDPLLEYLQQNHGQLLTQAERKAMWMDTVQTQEGPRWLTDDPAVLSLLTEGKAGLGRAIEQRLRAELAGELVINRCPKCGALARTSKARQCRQCPHTWRDSPV